MVLPHSLADVREALCELGHMVFVQDLLQISQSSDTGHGLDVAIIDGIISSEPDCIVTINSAGLVPAYLAVMPERRKYVSWFYDDPLENFRAKQMDFSVIAHDYHIFCWDRAYLPTLRELGFSRSTYMPFATNPELHCPSRHGRFRYDVSFVGHFTQHRADHIRELALADIVVDVFGDPAWVRVAHPNVRFHGPADHRRQVPEIYSESKINLNITNAQLLTSLPVRVFDVLACEGFLLTDYRRDVEELFTPGKELALYAGPTDLVRKVRHYLERPAERQRMASAGLSRVRERFTFRHQLSAILQRVAKAAEIPPKSELPDGQALLALWLTGLSYLKFHRYADAERQLLGGHARAPNEPNLLLGLSVLANHRGRVSEAASWVERLSRVDSGLARFGSELVGATRAGVRVQCWERLYGALQNVSAQSDGTVAGWEPQLVRPESTASCLRGEPRA